MSRRIWISEGHATDGEMYGRALQLPEINPSRLPSSPQRIGTDVQRKLAAVVKVDMGEIGSCPCLDVGLKIIEDKSVQEGDACVMG
ncbi:hypothetical protein [Acidovorax sp. SUPP3334]|uniref:hypothetical protein n=1 Tax=Acidovorax sp. SUPP3334 TaxID=2920881 RepID=UPI0023DE4ED6|nr:hypothetical protein [Acidovorax sp. SUPP3334]GKT27158.1 hypothetical protein AVHM3334_22890 [Acidovorax sp. SUPP3334]